MIKKLEDNSRKLGELKTNDRIIPSDDMSKKVNTEMTVDGGDWKKKTLRCYMWDERKRISVHCDHLYGNFEKCPFTTYCK